MPIPIRLIFAAFAVALASLSPAQEETIDTELIALSLVGQPGELYFRSGTEVLELSALKQGISSPLKYSGPSTLALYANEVDAESAGSGGSGHKPTFQVDLESGSDRVLLLFTFPAGTEEEANLTAYGISDADFGEGDYRIFNFSKQEIQMTMMDETTSLAPDEHGDIKPKDWKKSGENIPTTLGITEDEKTRTVYSTVWGHRHERRSYIFISDSDDRNRPLSIKKFYDLPSIKAPQ